MELRVLYIRTVLTSCKSLSALSSGRSSTARLTGLHRSQSTLTYILSERSFVHLTCGDATRLRYYRICSLCFSLSGTTRDVFKPATTCRNDGNLRERVEFLAAALTARPIVHTLCGSSPIDALFLSIYLSGITRKKEKIELVCSVDETWLPVVVDGQTGRTEKLGTSFKSKFLFPIDPDPSNHRCC